MSKFSDLVNITKLNEHKFSLTGLTDVQTDFQRFADMQVGVVCGFKIEARVGAKVTIDEHDGAAIEEAVKKVKQSIIEEVYGEFRLPLHLIRHAIYRQDVREAKKLLDQLENRMFDE